MSGQNPEPRAPEPDAKGAWHPTEYCMSQNFETLLFKLFDGLTAATPWITFLRELEAYMGCQRCALFLHPPTERDTGLVNSRTPGTSDPSAMLELIQDSPFTGITSGQVHILSRMMSPEEFQMRHPHHYQYNQALGLSDLLAINLTDPNTGASFRFRMGRSHEAGLFGSPQEQAAIRLLPFLTTAVSLYAQLIQHRRELYFFEETSSLLKIAAVVMDNNGKILTMNPVAEALLRDEQDFFVRNGKLHCADSGSDARLHRYLRQLGDSSTQDETDVFIQVPRSDHAAGSWFLMAKQQELTPEFRNELSSFVSLLIRGSNQEETLSVDSLEELFGLTAAEALLTQRLLRGETLTDAAKALNRSRSTVRVQLASIFSKTGVHKQHQLISHILHTAIRLWL